MLSSQEQTPASAVMALQRMEAEKAPKPQLKAPAKDGPFTFKKAKCKITYGQFSKTGGELLVFVPEEKEAIGRASFEIKDVPLAPRPKADEPYTKEHTVGVRAGKVAHLTGIYNLSRTRDGPADIYTGFGEQLLQFVEQDAKGLGAWMIYLEAAPSPVRVDPNTNEKVIQDPATFYARFGWGPDLAQQAHNSAYLQAQAKALQLTAEETLRYVTKSLEALREAVWMKVLA